MIVLRGAADGHCMLGAGAATRMKALCRQTAHQEQAKEEAATVESGGAEGSILNRAEHLLKCLGQFGASLKPVTDKRSACSA